MNSSNCCSYGFININNQKDCREVSRIFQTLSESEAKYRNLIEKLPVMLYAAQAEPPYAPIYVSPEFASFGYPLEQWHSNADMWTRILHPEDRDWVLRETEAAMSTLR